MSLSSPVGVAFGRAFVLSALAAASLAAFAQDVPQRQKPAFPALNLPDREAAGQRAVDVLGARLPEVARHYGQSADELRSRLLNDRRMRIDRRGRVFFVEELEGRLPTRATSPFRPATGATAGTGTDGLIDGTLAPLDQTFLLHSKPGAPRTIYLNFKGATLNGTAWNNGSAITALPYDLDNIPYSFNTTELQRIQGIWQRVAEDFAPFNVNVTTEAPPADVLQRSGSTDSIYGTTVLITSRSGVYSCDCGGVAYLGVFDDTSEFYKPALVFYDALGPGDERYVAEAASHEAGHNMGLNHDGSASAGYYTGHGSGATGWAPIMGVGYYQPLVQWSRGQYSGANNTEDDYTVMQANGLPLRTDDHGGSTGTATVLAGSATGGMVSASATGVVERPGDVDLFAIAAGAGSASFTVSPAARSANLDVLARLTDAAGTVLATANPADALNATMSVTLPAAGTYYLSVTGTGKGDPLGTGYTNYGSLGQYAVTASVPQPGNLAPVAAITASTLRGTAPLAVNFDGSASRDPDGSIASWSWTFGDGATASGPTASRTFANPGSYTVQLRVTDNGGASSATSVQVQVDPQVVLLPMRVADIAMSRAVARNGTARATAAVKVVDGNGLGVSGVTVAGTWSGLVSGSASLVTDSTGVARFASKATRATSGTFTFTVTGATLSGYNYVPANNTETSDSIAR